MHKEPFSFRIQTFIAIGNKVQNGETSNGQRDIHSTCGVLNNLMAYKQKKGDIILELEPSDNQLEAKDMNSAIIKAEKIY